MYYSQFFICASLTIITYGCSRRRVYGSEKVETTKKDVAAVASNSTSETRETPVEITAKSDRAEWFPQEAPKLELQERRKPSLQEQRKQMAMYEESKGPHAPKPLSMDYFKLKPTTEGGPNGKRAEPPAQIKNVLMKTAIIVTPKSDADKFRSLKNVELKKTQECDWVKERKGPKKHVFVLEPISFLDSENRNEELKRASQDDETINDAPSLARVNISKDSEEMPSSQGQIKAKAEVGEKLPTAKEVSLDESQLYPLQKTMGSQRLEANEILALDKTPYPSSEGRANQ
ncbi:hypothetical protein ANCCAN_04589 [Ancylostoma caninum]|uniref:Uncharacterized protein n=1 Tax=Ancylostoma caninum TaxID=29170 RepID=A0A368H0N2_ANCCA|nr:hypothetical protein ANCCAN_04589 [Ancylostoma caninum]